MPATTALLLAACLAGPFAQAEGPPKSVLELLEAHDRALMSDLRTYIEQHPKAEDVEQAYMTLFERAIENDWFHDAEAAANRYLQEKPGGPVEPLAQIVATMARAEAGKFDEALAVYAKLMKDLNQPDQEEFAANFADSLALYASRAGKYAEARRVYEILIEQFGDNPALVDMVHDNLARFDMVGKPAPRLDTRDVDGQPINLNDYRGKYVLVDFWATWCEPCIAELPNLRAMYDRYHPRGFDILGVSLDETRQPLVDFTTARKIPWKQVHNATSASDVVAAFGVNTIPATYLIDPQGNVVRIDARGKALEQALAELIR